MFICHLQILFNEVSLRSSAHFLIGLFIFLLLSFKSSLCICIYIFSFFKNKFIYLFIFGCVGSSLLHAGFLQLWRAGATLRCGAQASHCSSFSLWSTGSWCAGFSSCGTRALEHRLSSGGARAQLLLSMWDLPGPGIKPVSPALAGGFLSSAPPGKSLCIFWIIALYQVCLLQVFSPGLCLVFSLS